jgi:hypothetical protein
MDVWDYKISKYKRQEKQGNIHLKHSNVKDKKKNETSKIYGYIFCNPKQAK